MDRTLELDITTELLELLAHPTMSTGDTVCELPASVYTDDDRWSKERRRLFGELPLVAALSGELPNAGDWKNFDGTGTSIVLVRGDDGVVRGFRNACRHRGAIIVEQARGSSRSFTCPYHSWTYDRQGALIGIPQAASFEGVCREERGLRAISVEERAGVIWVVPNSNGESFDLSGHLGEFDSELQRWNLDSLHFFEQREHRIAANWKLAIDTFTEAYHIPNLHKRSVGLIAAGGLNLTARFGKHHRQALALKPLKQYRELPRERWAPFADGAIAFVYLIFPNTALLFFGDHAEVFQVFPGETIGTSITLQSMFDYAPIESDERRAVLKTVFDYFFNVVGTEDYRMAAGIQRMLERGSDETFVLGRCESVTQGMHEDYQRFIDAGLSSVSR